MINLRYDFIYFLFNYKFKHPKYKINNHLGIYHSGEFLQIPVLAKISFGISAREGNLSCNCLDHAGGKRYRNEAVCNE